MPRLRYAGSIFAFVIGACGFSLIGLCDDAPSPSVAADRPIDFVKDIQPILRKSCYSCHGAEMQESGLRLDIRERALIGGDIGKLLIHFIIVMGHIC